MIFKASKGEEELVALKRIQTKRLKKASRFIQEIKSHVRLSSQGAKNIITVLDHKIEELPNGSVRGYIVMPLAKSSLQDIIKLFIGRVELSLEVFRGIVNGINEAHKNEIIHRDIKPSNILFLDSTVLVPLVSDFGICLLKDIPKEDRLTEVGETVGAKFFMAPEQERGGITEVNESADIYALGKLLHYMLTERTLPREKLDEAFTEEEMELNPRLRVILQEILERAIVEDKNERLQSANELLTIIEKLQREFGTSTGGEKSSGMQSDANEGQQINFEGNINDLYSYYTKELMEGRDRQLKLEFDKFRRIFQENWGRLYEEIKNQPEQTPSAARSLIVTQPDIIALTLAMARCDCVEIFQDFKRFLEFVTKSTEPLAGYLAVIGIPHVQAGFLYMAAAVLSLYCESWGIFSNLLTTKFEWYYQSGRPLYSYGFDHVYFFGSEALKRKPSLSHDLFRELLDTPEITRATLLEREELLNKYVQTQMLMTILAFKLLEEGEDVFVWPDFGRFGSYRVDQLLDRAHNDDQYARGLLRAFNETPEDFFNKLNSRLDQIRQKFRGENFFWRSISFYEPR